MVQDYYISRLRAIEREGNARRAALRTKADAEAYVENARSRIAAAFGPMPEKAPLNARTTGIIDRDTYVIEKVIFESRPQFFITANLYLPKDRGGRCPAVLGTCGHSPLSKAVAAYQSFAQGLARQGYIVLIFDPMGQGERVQLVSADLAPLLSPIPGNSLSVTEHLHCGKPLLLLGESLAGWFAWDGIRALDFLLSRPEVDPRHVGVTGNSGGGTQTTWLCALDPRITMAAPSCFVTTLRRNLENENIGDAEQIPPKLLAHGLDLLDFFAAFAPKPLILLGQEKDFFDARGVEEAFARLQPLYRLLGAEENVKVFVGPDAHGYSQPNREAMYGWFNRLTKRAGTRNEPGIKLEAPVVLQCTARGQVAELGSENIATLMRRRANERDRTRPVLSGAELERAVAEVLKLPTRHGPPDYRLMRARSRRLPTGSVGCFGVETEPGILAVTYRLSDGSMFHRPPRSGPRAALYVSHRSAEDELGAEPLVAHGLKAEADAAFFACDVRGIGASQPASGGRDFLHPYGLDYFHAMHGLMLDEPYVGRKTHDVLTVIDWLRSLGHDHVHLIARGFGSVPATFAALLSPSVRSVTLKHAPASFRAIVDADDYDWPVSLFPWGALERFDLPDCYRALAGKNLRQLEPRGARVTQ